MTRRKYKNPMTPPKKLPRNCQEHIENSQAIIRKGVHAVRIIHDQSTDINDMHRMMNILDIFDELRAEINLIEVEEK